MRPKDANGMANSVDPDQTAPLGAVWSGSTLFAQTCLSKNLGTLRYIENRECYCIVEFIEQRERSDAKLVFPQQVQQCKSLFTIQHQGWTELF